MNAINARMRGIGLTKSHLNRVMMDTLAARQGREKLRNSAGNEHAVDQNLPASGSHAPRFVSR